MRFSGPNCLYRFIYHLLSPSASRYSWAGQRKVGYVSSETLYFTPYLSSTYIANCHLHRLLSNITYNSGHRLNNPRSGFAWLKGWLQLYPYIPEITRNRLSTLRRTYNNFGIKINYVILTLWRRNFL